MNDTMKKVFSYNETQRRPDIPRNNVNVITELINIKKCLLNNNVSDSLQNDYKKILKNQKKITHNIESLSEILNYIQKQNAEMFSNFQLIKKTVLDVKEKLSQYDIEENSDTEDLDDESKLTETVKDEDLDDESKLTETVKDLDENESVDEEGEVTETFESDEEGEVTETFESDYEED